MAAEGVPEELPGTKPRAPNARASLSDDLLVNVFRRLPSRQDKAAAALVCTRWHRAICLARRTCHIWRVEALPGVIRWCPQLTSIDCSGTIHMEDEQVMALAERYAATVTHLDLSKNKKVTERGLAAIGRHCKHLKSLSLTAGTYGDMALMKLSACTSLEVLKLTNCRAATDVGISCLVARCKGLRELSLHWCMNITDEAVEVLVVNCPHLTTLDLAYTRVTAKAMEALAAAPSLKTLLLGACPLVDNDALKALAKGSSSLEVLDVAACALVSNEGVRALAEASLPLRQLLANVCPQISDGLLPLVARFPLLETLKLDRNTITDTGLLQYGASVQANGVEAGSPENAVPHLPLADFSIARCADITERGLLRVLPLWPRLQHLNIMCCKGVAMAPVLHSLAQHSSDLRSLLVEGCHDISAEDLRALAASCPKLESLDLTDTDLSEEGVLAVAGFQELQALKLGFCQEVTDPALEAIGASCPGLTELDLYRCAGFGAKGLGALSSGCSSLQQMNMSYCTTGCTDASLAAFCQAASSLRNLEMRGCQGVTSLGLAALGSGCRSLEELDVKKCRKISDAGLVTISKGCPYLRQINLSYCPVSDKGLKALASMGCMVKFNLVHCRNITMPGLCEALLLCPGLRKVKLLPALRHVINSESLAELESRGCFFRWMDKPPDLEEEKSSQATEGTG